MNDIYSLLKWIFDQHELYFYPLDIVNVGRSCYRNKNQYLVLLELQADCYAGVWAALSQQQKNWLEDGDVEEGLKAAASIGDDTLQRNTGRRVNVESFTHGSSEQRVKWLRKGMSTGDLSQCNTFGG